MQGEAMEDGAAGETIRVRNEQSKKIIEAVIRSKEEVEVRIP
jgi:flagella basal body P-ring formation protein FlgA